MVTNIFSGSTTQKHRVNMFWWLSCSLSTCPYPNLQHVTDEALWVLVPVGWGGVWPGSYDWCIIVLVFGPMCIARPSSTKATVPQWTMSKLSDLVHLLVIDFVTDPNGTAKNFQDSNISNKIQQTLIVIT